MKQTKCPYMRLAMQVYDVETSTMILAGSDTHGYREPNTERTVPVVISGA